MPVEDELREKLEGWARTVDVPSGDAAALYQRAQSAPRWGVRLVAAAAAVTLVIAGAVLVTRTLRPSVDGLLIMEDVTAAMRASSTVRLEYTVEMWVGNRVDRPVTISMQGVSDMPTGDARFVVSYSAPVSDSQSGAWQSSSFTSEMRRVDGVTYTRYLDVDGRPVPAEGLVWRRTGDVTGQPGPDFDGPALLSLLEQAADVERVGAEVVDGRFTTRYQAQVPILYVMAWSQGQSVEGLEAVLRGTQGEEVSIQLLEDTATFSMWLDGEGLLRRVLVESGASEFQSGRVRTDLRLYEYGVDVDVTAPAESEVH